MSAEQLSPSEHPSYNATTPEYCSTHNCRGGTRHAVTICRATPTILNTRVTRTARTSTAKEASVAHHDLSRHSNQTRSHVRRTSNNIIVTIHLHNYRRNQTHSRCRRSNFTILNIRVTTVPVLQHTLLSQEEPDMQSVFCQTTPTILNTRVTRTAEPPLLEEASVAHLRFVSSQ